jgi:hypothetical protein
MTKGHTLPDFSCVFHYHYMSCDCYPLTNKGKLFKEWWCLLSPTGGHRNCPKKERLLKHTDMTIHWKALEKHFLMVPLVFRFDFRGKKCIFWFFFLIKNPSILKALMRSHISITVSQYCYVSCFSQYRLIRPRPLNRHAAPRLYYAWTRDCWLKLSRLVD